MKLVVREDVMFMASWMEVWMDGIVSFVGFLF